MISDSQKSFLSERLAQASKGQSKLIHLRTILLALGGEEMVPPGSYDEDLEALLSVGKVIPVTKIIVRDMQASDCHRNIARLWERGDNLVGIGTGYALWADGLWRQHTWGMKSTSTVIDTNGRPEMYFGIVFTGDTADQFADAQIY